MPDSKAKMQWAKENMWLVGVKFHRKNDADLIQYLESIKERQKTIKAALREYMKDHPDGVTEKEK